MGLFVGNTDNGKTNTALWFTLRCLLDQIALEAVREADPAREHAADTGGVSLAALETGNRKR